MAESYPFLRINDEALGILYSFINEKFGYTVYFNDRLYADLVADYESLFGNSYSFGFYNTIVSEEAKFFGDDNISCTITKIIEDFFTSEGNEAVVLFHCDAHDKRQYSRHKIFSRWYKNSPITASVYMYTIEVAVGEITHYMGFICLNTHPNIDKLKAEFDQAAQKVAPEPAK